MKRNVLFSFLLAVAISGCGQPDTPKFESVQHDAVPFPLVDAKLKVAQRDPAQSIASAPDRGALFEARSGVPVAGGKAVRIELSESHALASIAAGILRLPMADGSTRTYRYLRRMEYPDGTWTWVGRGEGDNPGLDAVVTFGASAVFGSFPQADGSTLQLETTRGRTFAYLRPVSAASVASEALDHLIPGYSRGVMPSVANRSSAAPLAAELPDRYGNANTIDVLAAYFAYAQPIALPRDAAHVLIRYFADVANVALRNSKVNAQIRIVGFQELAPVDPARSQASSIGSNLFFLKQMTGEGDGGTPIARPGWAVAVEQARNTHGADLAMLFRFTTEQPAQASLSAAQCGASWLIGGQGQATSTADGKYGYLVVNKAIRDFSGANDYAVIESCPDTTLAHQLGHALGAAHNVGDAGYVYAPGELVNQLVTGRFSYSYGHKENTGDRRTSFNTIMGDVNQAAAGNALYRVYSNPDLKVCQRRSCGLVDQADLARTFRQTVPIVATFRAQVMPLPDRPPVTLLAINKGDPSFRTIGYQLGQADNYLSYTVTRLGPLLGGDGAWVFAAADWDLDGTPELFRIHRMGYARPGGNTAIHILPTLPTALSDARRMGLDYDTLLHQTGSDRSWSFKLGDYNLDGRVDLYAIKKQGASGKTEVHVLNGRAHFKQYLNQSATALEATGTNSTWSFDLGDYNQDGMLDLYAFKRSTIANQSEVHVMDGATRFTSFLLHKKLPLPPLSLAKRWELNLAEADGDDFPDLHVIDTADIYGSRMMKLTVLRGAGDFQTVLSSGLTALPATPNPDQWDFVMFSAPFAGLKHVPD